MNENQKQLLKILQEEVQPALGCTGPTVFSYVAAEARDAVGGTPKKIIIRGDKDKCAKENDVGIPGTNALGVKMGAALGAFAGDPAAKLEVLHSVTPELERAAYEFTASGNVILEPDWDTPLIGIYVDITVETDRGVGRAIVIKNHVNLVYKSANGKAIISRPFDRTASIAEESNDFIAGCKIRDMYDFAVNTPIEYLLFLRDAVTMNKKLAEAALNGELGKTFASSMLKRDGSGMINRAKALTAAAAEARMVGYNLPAMACATSGNVGITASLPISSLAETMGKSEEEALRALAFSFLLTIMGKKPDREAVGDVRVHGNRVVCRRGGRGYAVWREPGPDRYGNQQYPGQRIRYRLRRRETRLRAEACVGGRHRAGRRPDGYGRGNGGYQRGRLKKNSRPDDRFHGAPCKGRDARVGYLPLQVFA